jgi:hypothetical protein
MVSRSNLIAGRLQGPGQARIRTRAGQRGKSKKRTGLAPGNPQALFPPSRRAAQQQLLLRLRLANFPVRRTSAGSSVAGSTAATSSSALNSNRSPSRIAPDTPFSTQNAGAPAAGHRHQ